MFKVVFLAFWGLMLTGAAWSQTNTIIDTSKTIICLFTESPEFPGGVDSLQSYIKKNLRWPGKGYDDRKGRVIVGFMVETTGKLSDIRVVKGLSPEIDKEAIRLMKKSPQWKPAIQNGKPKRVQYMLSIPFKRTDD